MSNKLWLRKTERLKRRRKWSDIRILRRDATCTSKISHQQLPPISWRNCLEDMAKLSPSSSSLRMEKLSTPSCASNYQKLLPMPNLNSTNNHTMASNCTSTITRSRKSESNNMKTYMTRLTSKTLRSNHLMWTIGSPSPKSTLSCSTCCTTSNQSWLQWRATRNPDNRDQCNKEDQTQVTCKECHLNQWWVNKWCQTNNQEWEVCHLWAECQECQCQTCHKLKLWACHPPWGNTWWCQAQVNHLNHSLHPILT